jgi:glycosyltransferase involved in cell wall biosynthesis
MNEQTPETMYVTIGLHGGGAERLLTNVILQQTPRDHISVVSLSAGGVFRETLVKAGVRVTDLGMTRNRDVVRGVFALAALIRARKPVVMYGWMYNANLLAFLARLIAGGRHSRLYWGIFCTDGCGTAFLPLQRIVRRVNALLSRFIEGVIYNADEARDYHHGIGFREPTSLVIANCVDPEVFRHDPGERAPLRAELGLEPDTIVVVMVARADPMKDWHRVLEAVRDVPGIVLVAVGRGTDTLPAQSGVIGLGWRDDIVRILNAADIFLLGSAFGEGTSLALEEAMLCGLPSVVTDVGGNATLAGDAGIVVPPRKPAAIRAAIMKLAADATLRERLGHTARHRAAARESRVDTCRMLEQLSLTDEATA